MKRLIPNGNAGWAIRQKNLSDAVAEVKRLDELAVAARPCPRCGSAKGIRCVPSGRTCRQRLRDAD